MSFQVQTFLESCVGNDDESLFGSVVLTEEQNFCARFGKRFGGNESDEDSSHFLIEWYEYARILSFCIILPYDDFGLHAHEEGILLVDQMNRHRDQMVRFSSFLEDDGARSKPTCWICCHHQLLVPDELQDVESWEILRVQLSYVLIHLVGETEWHMQNSSKPKLRIIQAH